MLCLCLHYLWVHSNMQLNRKVTFLYESFIIHRKFSSFGLGENSKR
jgi:hypothetical protein